MYNMQRKERTKKYPYTYTSVQDKSILDKGCKMRKKERTRSRMRSRFCNRISGSVAVRLRLKDQKDTLRAVLIALSKACK